MTDLERYGRHAEGCPANFCNICHQTHPPTPWLGSSHAFLPKPCSCGFAEALLREGWQPIETLPSEVLNGDLVILRPHSIWGAMDVRYKPSEINGVPYNWMNGDYTTAWPDCALLPFWQPLPAPPLPQGVSDVPHTE